MYINSMSHVRGKLASLSPARMESKNEVGKLRMLVEDFEKTKRRTMTLKPHRQLRQKVKEGRKTEKISPARPEIVSEVSPPAFLPGFTGITTEA